MTLLFKLLASLREKAALTSLSNVADASRRSSVLIETPDMYMYTVYSSYIFGFTFP